jgi:hypothetical protein
MPGTEKRTEELITGMESFILKGLKEEWTSCLYSILKILLFFFCFRKNV